ncbi:MAG: ABC transporter ATP-binding protein [Thomasclavelia sp.]
MIKVICWIKELSGKESKKLILPVVLSIIDSLLNSYMYGIMLFLLLDLLNKTFTYQKLLLYTTVLIIVFVVRCIIQAISFTKAQCTGSKITYHLRLQIANHLRRLNLGYFDNNSIGKLTEVLITDVSDFNTIITHCLCDLVKVISFTIISIIVAFLINWQFGLVLMILVIIAMPLLIISGKISAKNSVKLKRANQDVIAQIIEYVTGMKTFRLYNLIGSHFKRLNQALQNLKAASIKAEVSLLPLALGFSTITSFIIPITLMLGVYLFSKGIISRVDFLIIILLSVSISNIMSVLSSLYPQVGAILKASENILLILHEKPLPYTKDTVCFKNYDIKFSHVFFQYSDRLKVLQDVSFLARQGTTTALIGPSGSGKTTIASLIAHFWDVQKGMITIGGENIKEIAPDTLTKYISIVFQDVYLLNDTVFNNICLGNLNATKEAVIAAAKAANCHEFIKEMEHGYDTILAEGGSTLSGGQKQRISIARALLKDAPIILLDETTSNLDADNEFEIQAAFKKLMKNKTVLVIAHRLNTIINADNIIVLDDGVIIESGRHQDLLQQKGWYAAMVEAQQKAQDWKISSD